MLRQAQKIRIYPTDEQKQQLAGAMGCCRWWWNYALNRSIETYKQTGKGLSRAGLNALLPNLKKEHEWLKTEVYSQSLQQTSLNLSRAFINFFEKRARFPRYKSKHGKQSVGFPQSVTVNGDWIKLPKIGLVKAVFDRRYYGKIKTVTISKDSSDRYFASIIYELEVCFISGGCDKIIGLDLGIKDFCIADDGTKTSKYANPRHIKKHEKNLPKCLTQQPKMKLSVREWICINRSCNAVHDRDEAASKNISTEGIRILKTDGAAVSASGGSVRPDRGRKTKVRQHPAKLETPSSYEAG